MSHILLSLILVTSGMVLSEEMPDVVGLGAVALADRKSAASLLEEWVLKDQAMAKEVILKKYLRCANPEVRVRLLELLERAYFPVKGFVGIRMMPNLLDNNRLRFRGGGGKVNGVRVMGVSKGSPAEAGGLRTNDVVLRINNWEVKGGYDVTSQVADQIQRNPPTTPITLRIQRKEEVLDIKLKLAVLPVPSVRARIIKDSIGNANTILTTDLKDEISEFQNWLSQEIEKDRKNLIADRRL
ncbi:MAG: C-terminal processing protease CtpA/Prc [Paracoccaceae bacterium]|jgi:C-terminal processing protease CtpA/Prc